MFSKPSLQHIIITAVALVFILSFAAQSGNNDVIKVTKTAAKSNMRSQVSDSKYIAKIVRYNAETFCPNTADDYSTPYYNYIPRGTVDYCDPKKVTDPDTGKKYYVLASGMRVYAKNSDVKVYKGTLKDENTVAVSSTEVENNRTRICFKVDWKAPFKLKLSPQDYPQKSKHKYSVTSATYNRVDISFSYCTKASGEIDLTENPLFYKYEWHERDGESVLRLYLKKQEFFTDGILTITATGNLCFLF